MEFMCFGVFKLEELKIDTGVSRVHICFMESYLWNHNEFIMYVILSS